jgi:hypothetical protein
LSPVLFRGYNNKSRTRASFKVDFRKLRQLIDSVSKVKWN